MSSKKESSPLFISSTTNQKVKDSIKLRDKQERDKTNLFGVEGEKEILRAVNSGFVLVDVFFCRKALSGLSQEILTKIVERKETNVYEVSNDVFRKLVLRESSGGLWAVFSRRILTFKTVKLSDNPFILVLDNIEKPGNLGAILRSADGAGVEAVFLTGSSCDIYNPNVIRASLGTVFSLPIVVTDEKEMIEFCKNSKIKIAGAALDKRAAIYTSQDFHGSTAVVLGSEAKGLGKALLDSCDVLVKIPMKGSADSLNVGAAATIFVYEVLRQRTTT